MIMNCGCHNVSPAEVRRLGLGAYAQAYQRAGWAVLGLRYARKEPHELLPHGVHQASRDPAMAQWLWSREKMAGVGVATGQASGLAVIDLDVKHGDDGPAHFDAFLAEAARQGFPPLPHDAAVATPSGGWHLYLSVPLGRPVPARLGILPGVDIKGDAGYVVAPPSRIWVDTSSGGRVLLAYRWAAGCPHLVPPAPEWFLQWISGAEATGAASGYSGAPPDLEKLIETGIRNGERNVTVHRLACQMFRAHLSSAGAITAVRDKLQPVLDRTDLTGFPEAELMRTLRSAYDFVEGSVAGEKWRTDGLPPLGTFTPPPRGNGAGT